MTVLVLLIGAVAISSLNADYAALNLYWYQLNLPMGFMLLLFASLGMLAGLFLGWLFWTWPANRKKTYWEREYFKLKQQEPVKKEQKESTSTEVVNIP